MKILAQKNILSKVPAQTYLNALIREHTIMKEHIGRETFYWNPSQIPKQAQTHPIFRTNREALTKVLGMAKFKDPIQNQNYNLYRIMLVTATGTAILSIFF